MKDKLLSTLKKLESDNIFYSRYYGIDFFYSLTIDYKNIIESYQHEKFNLIDIENIINSYDEIETYNLTIYNYARYDENRYKKYYHNADLIFHSDGVVFYFTSPYLSSNELETNIDNIFNIYDEYIKCSKSLYDIINRNQD